MVIMAKKENKAYYKSKLGIIEITATDDAITALDFTNKKSIPQGKVPPCLKECIKQIDEYFKGKRKEFSLKLQPEGTDFQLRVWKQLSKIPFGKTVSYQDVARGIGNLKAARAVGGAIGTNKISIIIPCHRVIGSDGSLTGFGGGLWRKKWLLRHES
jgi:methylated-DNA-[protein]-cysteine S-methyltransferase